MEPEKTLKEKLERLDKRLYEIGREGLCVAFSGGVDSTLLLHHAAALPITLTAVTFSSRFLPKVELEEAAAFASSMNVAHRLLTFDVLADAAVSSNPPDRCYHCKRYIFSSLKALCRKEGLGAIADGTNADDLLQYRPGLRALRELGIHSPLAECGLNKAEVRRAAQAAGLKVYSKPSAPCLATRVPYGTPLTEGLLKRIEKSEAALRELGLEVCRVRAHGDIARLEVPPADFERLLGVRETLAASLKEAGFLYITLDLEGFRSGSMDIPLGRR